MTVIRAATDSWLPFKCKDDTSESVTMSRQVKQHRDVTLETSFSVYWNILAIHKYRMWDGSGHQKVVHK